MIPGSIRLARADRRIGLALILIGFTSTSAAAQDVRGGAEGRVVSAEGQPLPGVTVTAEGPPLPGRLVVTSDAGGYFLLPALPVGTYSLRLTAPGYREVVVGPVPVRLGETTGLGSLPMSPGELELPPLRVEIHGAPIDFTSTSIGASLRRAAFERLPTERDYRSLTILLPHINTSFLGDGTSAAGATGLESQFFVDGMNVTAPYKATTGTGLPYNFVKEIEVRQGGYQAEFGGALGMTVNVVTHTGGNEFDFEAFGYLSGSPLAGDPKPGVADLRVEDFSSFDLGFRASGPVVQDRLWFSVAYNPHVDVQDIEIPGLGFERDRRTSHQFAGKLDWRASEAVELTLSAFGDPTTQDRIAPLSGPFAPPTALENKDPFLGRLKEGGVNLALRGIFRISDGLLLEANLARHNRAEDESGRAGVARTDPLFIDRTTGVWSGGFGQRVDIASHRYSGRVSATWTTGRHTLKTGIEYQNTVVDKSEIFTEPGIIEFDGTLYTTGVARNVNTTRGRLPSAYLQDSWRISDHLRVNAGLRWDGQYFVAAGDSIAQAFTKQWQPRVGIIFLPGDPGSQSQKVFAHYGRFFQRLPLSLFTIGHSLNDQRIRISDVDPRVDPDSVLFEQVIVDPCCPAVEKVEGALGEHIDELIVGYERALGRTWTLGIRGIYRLLRDAFASGFTLGPSGPRALVGTRGEGALDFLPPGERDYRALEVTVHRRGARWNATASYVLSRTTGNYTGQYDLDTRNAFPGIPFLVELESQAPNSSGRLPNDRLHVFKLTGAYDFGVGLDVGVFFTWQSGTPLSELGSTGFLYRPLFLSERGSAGRTPALWDLNLRFAYDLPAIGGVGGQLVADVLHIGNPRQVVNVDQTRYRGIDPALGPLAAFTEPYEVLAANQVAPNSRFGAPLRHQPPMAVRLGLRLTF